MDVDHVNDLGWTALLEAVILGDGGAAHTEIVRLLVDAGADVSIPDGEGVTALEPRAPPATTRSSPSSRSGIGEAPGASRAPRTLRLQGRRSTRTVALRVVRFPQASVARYVIV